MAEARFDMGKKGELVIANKEYNGKHYLDLRYYYKGFPTKVGITITDVVRAEEIGKAVVEAGKAVLAARREAKENTPDTTPPTPTGDVEPF